MLRLLSRKPSKPTEVSRPRASTDLSVRLQRECTELTAIYRTQASIGQDSRHGWWLHLPEWPLPEGYQPRSLPLLFVIPAQYPSAGPPALYLQPEGQGPAGWRLDALLPLEPASEELRDWQRCMLPVPWRDGDDLERVLSHIHAVLAVATNWP